MTDISRKAVERICIGLEQAAKTASGLGAISACIDAAQTLRALRDALDEAENKVSSAYAQAITDALNAIDGATTQQAYDAGHRIHYDDLQEFFADQVLELRNALPYKPQEDVSDE